ncbi:MAG: helix-turn-helix domain-containing protein [Ignavibacteriae bacterium]|nr:helix-turn-helix domain-containing protein [Ignavibacteriota bacterium]MCB9217172.1 helix-turn-helix domain-containing protein [Ignavibacteria bacterium]
MTETLSPNNFEGSRPDNVLTSEQSKLLVFIVEFVNENAYFPSIPTICKSTNRSSRNNVRRLLKQLEHKGYIIASRGGPRVRTGWRLTEQAIRLGKRSWPLLGVIPAGRLQEALDEAPKVISLLSDILHMDPDDAVIRVTGEWMTGANIHPGDFVHISPVTEFSSKDILAVHFGRSGISLRYVFEQKSTYVLEAANPSIKPITFPKEQVVIFGKVTAVISTTVYRAG